MKLLIKLFMTALFLISPLSHGATSASSIHWEYSGQYGPQHWGDLDPSFVQCKVGVNQSPIDISKTFNAQLPPLELEYVSSSTYITNNGHTAQIDVRPGNFLLVEDEKFELIQFHLHAPSEHSINGKRFLMETHFVHKNVRGELAVVAMLHNEGDTNEKLSHIEGAISDKVGERKRFRMNLKDLGIKLGDHDYYRYNGSLTTPPCTEGVRWFVIKEPRPISYAQQEIYINLIGEDSRGPQPLNSRIIVE